MSYHDRPCASGDLNSYRYLGRYGWIMIGAKSDAEALRETQRSTSDKVSKDNLQYWAGTRYAPVT